MDAIAALLTSSTTSQSAQQGVGVHELLDDENMRLGLDLGAALDGAHHGAAEQLLAEVKELCDSPMPDMPGTAAVGELTGDPVANLDLGSRDIVVAGGGAGLPGEVGAATGFGMEFTIHFRCAGEASVELGLDDDVVAGAETLTCDGQQHDIEVSLDTSPTTLTVSPSSQGDVGSASWVAAVTTT